MRPGGTNITLEQQKLVEDHHYLITSTMRNMNIPYYVSDDYYGYAAEGLCNAALKHNPMNGDFRSFAIECIKNRIRSERNRQMVRNEALIVQSIDDSNSKYMINKISYEDFKNKFCVEGTFSEKLSFINSREANVLEMIAQGYTYAECADQINMSESGIKKLVKRVRRKIKNELEKEK